MKQIFRYKAGSPTGFEIVDVADDYELQKGELSSLPNPCYTPMKLDVNGNLVSATLQESNQVAQQYLKANGIKTSGQSNGLQEQVAKLTEMVATQSAQLVSQKQINATLMTQLASLTAKAK